MAESGAPSLVWLNVVGLTPRLLEHAPRLRALAERGSTRLLEGVIPAQARPTTVADHDGDGVPDLMVKFDWKAVVAYLEGTLGEVQLTVSGALNDGTPFQISDRVTVIDEGSQ